MENSSMDIIFDHRDCQLVPNKTYHCQRCLNHGCVVPRKGHKRCCRYVNCACYNCSLVEERKLLNRAINSETEKFSSYVGDNEDFNDFQSSKNKIRHPKCARCAIHVPDSEPPPLKGHKRKCPYQDCVCRKCQLVSRRRSVMAKQIHLRRVQRYSNTDNSSSNSVDRMNFPSASIPHHVGVKFSNMFVTPTDTIDRSTSSNSEETLQVVMNPFLMSEMTSDSTVPAQHNKEKLTSEMQMFNGAKTLTLPLVPASTLLLTPASSLPNFCAEFSNVYDFLRQSSITYEHFQNYRGLFRSTLLNPFCGIPPLFLCNNDLVS